MFQHEFIEVYEARGSSTYSSSAGAGAGVTTARATDSEVDTRLVRLTSRGTVPIVLNNTFTGGGTLAREVRDGDRERSLIGRDRSRVRSENIPVHQLVTNNRVGSGVNDRDIGGAGMRSPDIVCDGNTLASGIALNVGSIVRVLHTLAQPKVAFGGEITLDELLLALDVTIRVGGHVVVDLGTTSAFHSRAGRSRSRRGNHTMTGNQGGRNGNEGDSVLHLVWRILSQLSGPIERAWKMKRSR